MMNKSDLENRLKKAIVSGLHLEDIRPEDIDSDAPLFNTEKGLMLDSLDAVELVVIVEKEFGVAIADAEEARLAFASVNALGDFIQTRQSQG